MNPTTIGEKTHIIIVMKNILRLSEGSEIDIAKKLKKIIPKDRNNTLARG